MPDHMKEGLNPRQQLLKPVQGESQAVRTVGLCFSMLSTADRFHNFLVQGLLRSQLWVAPDCAAEG